MIYIRDIASYIPNDYIDNYKNSERFSESKDFIDSKIGASKLSRMPEGMNTSDMAVKAVESLLNKTGLNKQDIDALVVVTQNGDFDGLPHTSALVQGKLELKEDISCFDISLGCSGYVYGLSILKAHMIEMGFDNAILVTADPYSKIIDENDRVTSLLFGDAATATLLSTKGELLIERPLLSTDGSGELALVKNDYLYMNGRQVFNFAATKVPNHVCKYLEKNTLAIDDVDLFLLHQGSAAIIDVIVRKLRVSKDKVPMDIKDTGNTVSSSIPLLLEKFINDTTKENIIISGFGVGLSWATNLLRRVKNA
ncbi:ketoacyl-ACP synthase III [Aliivibrio fischeri]|uniref:ketoacyl-ACP synthase III n=1 Tax=Aliivibrio fischeri TaxID=668 RepID=UPI00166BBCB2|nr:ketoacyl-ACP synthase III [Aliivibrio fischeri]USR95681.1 ketoacyl-ACP synthase III [Aliivibrio fischeri ATCC 7744 = JCM 18803 = DSM 507]GGK23946.1 3-oxoacyl-ACP synthase [Aliivibrio fischeri]